VGLPVIPRGREALPELRARGKTAHSCRKAMQALGFSIALLGAFRWMAE